MMFKSITNQFQIVAFMLPKGFGTLILEKKIEVISGERVLRDAYKFTATSKGPS